MSSAACGPTGEDDALTDASPSPTPPLADPYADAVLEVTYGEGAGFGQEGFPQIVLGPPVGGGLYTGSVDVLSLGQGGSIVLALQDMLVIDGPGIDLLVFENAFRVSSTLDAVYAEPGVVSVSSDGQSWVTFPCDLASTGYPGCAGTSPVLASPDNGISSTDPAAAGGNGFDLANVGLTEARFVRIEDASLLLNAAARGSRAENLDEDNTVGFDLDAIAVVNGRVP